MMGAKDISTNKKPTPKALHSQDLGVEVMVLRVYHSSLPF